MQSTAQIIGILLIGTLVAFSEQGLRPEAALRAAIEVETVKGDLRGAIQHYAKLAGGNDRAVAAKALIRMAGCHQKLGDTESRIIYERVLRDFADQKEAAAEARVHLNLLRPPAIQTRGMASRMIWTLPKGGDIFGAASRDGRFVPYVAWDKGGDLFLHDLVTGTERRLTNTATDKPGVKKSEEQYAEEYAFSRDGRLLAYSWFRGDKQRYELRVLPVQGNGIPPVRALLDHDDVSWIAPHDWSPDGVWVAVQLHRKDRSAQIGLVSARDGSLRILKSLDWRGTTGVYFSSDGNYVAYDAPPMGSDPQRDVHVLAIDGSREIPAVAHPGHDAIVGWSPDGARLLFASDRGGSMGLWALRFSGGNVHGSPELLKPDIGHFGNMGITASGSFIYYPEGFSGGDIQVASFDFKEGKFLSPPKQAVSAYVGTNQLPCWSRDGQYLAYVSRRNLTGSRYFVVGLRSDETGVTRELVPSPNFELLWSMSWSADGKSLLVGGRDAKGRNGFFRIDIRSGSVALVLVQESVPLFVEESPAGEALYYRGPDFSGRGGRFVKRDLVSGAETTLLEGVNLGAASLSPDGTYLAINTIARPRHPLGVILVSTKGGATKDLVEVAEPQMAGIFAWVPDSGSVLVRKQVSQDQAELWRFPVEAGQPAKLSSDPAGIPGLKVQPNGKQVVFAVPTPWKPVEVWTLENFLPASSPRN